MSEAIRGGNARQVLQGHRAGFASRVAADAVDLVTVWLLGLAVLLAVGTTHYVLVGPPFRLPAASVSVSGPLGALIAVCYLTFFWGSTGRTLGKQLAGLRAVNRNGGRLPPARALLRAVLCVLFPVGLLWVLFSRRNYAVHDLLVRSAVVYDWRYQAPPELEST
jgi:uncharacterized RDD family membrane protein YckC